MKIAIIGTGISGLTCAYHLHKRHDVSLFESNNYIGGHTHTHHIEKNGSIFNVDTGFIVFNKKTYPNFIKLIEQLRVDFIETSMSFSVRCLKSNLEYNGTNFNGLFADRLNLLKPSFYLFLKGILDFNKKAAQFLNQPSDMTLTEFFKLYKIKQPVVDLYLNPMIAAVWSTDPLDVLSLPAKFILSFFQNHGFLEIDDRPQWYVIKGGSNQYIKKIIQGYEHKIRLNCPVLNIRREANSITLSSPSGNEKFDAVIFATHSDVSLKILGDPSEAEVEILSSIPYTSNPTFLHQDASFLPRRKRTWASWNYQIPIQKNKGATVTYNMNILQGIQRDELFNVTLNPSHPIEDKYILKSIQYEHPLFSPKATNAQQRWSEISGKRNTYYCGAYWRNGFHEDGVVSALKVVEQMEQHEKQNL